MRKLFLKEPQTCSVCSREQKIFVVTEEQIVCSKCFAFLASKKFVQEHPNGRRYGKHKPFGRKIKNISKKIFAVDGVTTVYRGGCTN